jgi:sugar O-acyltransferase (sialic acid O-acetyltransferase NeuD family)
MPKKVIFWGGTGHAKVLRELVQYLDYELTAVFDNNPSVPSPFSDVPLYYGAQGFRKWKETQDTTEVFCVVTIGGARGHDRLEIQHFLEKEGLRPAIAVHPTAFVAGNAALSKGCQILAHATVCAEVKMGEACILNTACSVDHECRLGNGVHIGPGAILAGVVTIGDYSFIGTGAVVLPRVRIGENTTIGAGSVVTQDVGSGVVAYGNPARVARENTPHK